MTDQLQTAVKTIRAGDTKTGFEILKSFLAENPNSEKAWWVMSGLVPADRREHCLQEVLRINPDNEMAQEALERIQSSPLQSRTAEQERVPPPAPEPTHFQSWVYAKRGTIFLTLLSSRDLILAQTTPKQLPQVKAALSQGELPDDQLKDKKVLPLADILDVQHKRSTLRLIYQSGGDRKSLRMKLENPRQAHRLLDQLEKSLVSLA